MLAPIGKNAIKVAANEKLGECQYCVIALHLLPVWSTLLLCLVVDIALLLF